MHIAPGLYDEKVTLTRSGTTDAPITFTGANQSAANGSHQDTRIGNARDYGHDHALVLQGASHVRVQNLTAYGEYGSVVIDGGSDLVFGRNQVHATVFGDPGIDVKGNARAVTIRQNSVSGYIRLNPGVRDTVIATNIISGGEPGHPAVEADSAPGNTIVGNTFASGDLGAIGLRGASGGSTVENNLIRAWGTTAKDPVLVDVAAEAVTGTKIAYNSYPQGGVPAYRWAGKTYTTTADFTAASGQGDHDIIGDTSAPGWKSADGGPSPIVDAADENAPGATDPDINGASPVDNPWYRNSGTGTSRRDRGAYEITDIGAYYTPLGPVRVLDTRNGTGTTARAVPAGGTVDLQLAGQNGVPTSGLTAVSMNVTVTGTTGPGYLSVYPHGDTRPVVSNLNWTAGQTIPNLVTVKVKDGKVSFYNGSQGTVQIVADLLGSYAAAPGAGFTSTAPARLLDTRDGTGTSAKAPLPAGRTIDLQVTGRGGVPATGVTAVTLNMTVTRPTTAGFLTVYPHGTVRPTASSLNWTTGQTIPNLVTVPVKDGRVSLYYGGGNGTVDVIADVNGYFTATGGDAYFAIDPYRQLDTRSDDWIAVDYTDDGPIGLHPGPIAARRAPSFWYSRLQFPATAVAMNATVTGGTAPGYLTAYPTGTDRPLASNLNWTAGQTIANQVVTKTGGNGADDFYDGSDGPVHLVLDVNGYYSH
ncbi:hypothetical protein CFP65_3841 [Kitasatospora sp. MMS16-BH015]|uniref:right-handed parallel beta-helix repeat-containing protein n=1 Tax=Kitasatospora sp. MMS16-BH015 TaxID=2018025 RepID=UPI000CA0B210|nr:right-handed parallel beta-helix repeat-containing protein [Kitasatospora sp. MMS16-BH015]AUG78621.1 hypothetical protein CFP65_3841 [Kitasatospora sp. MMS16-BH015]